MTAWTLAWNNLSDQEKGALVEEAEYNSCPCCGDSGQTALAMFNAVVAVIEARNRAKRDMPRDEFLAWACRVSDHQKAMAAQWGGHALQEATA